jgi:hypothetical protein
MVTDRLARVPRAHFEIPGDLGPSGGRPQLRSAPPAGPVATLVPAAAWSAPPPGSTTRAAAPASVQAAATPAASPASPGIPDLGAAPMPDLGATDASSAMPTGAAGSPSGLGGLANRIVEALGNLLDPAEEDEGQPEDDTDTQVERDEEPDQKPERAAGAAEDAQEAVAAPTPPPAQGPTLQGPTAQEPPVRVPPPTPLPTPPAPGSTPCEIAADQLPKAG